MRYSVHARRHRVYSLVAAGGLLVGGLAASAPAHASPPAAPPHGGASVGSGRTITDNLQSPQAVEQIGPATTGPGEEAQGRSQRAGQGGQALQPDRALGHGPWPVVLVQGAVRQARAGGSDRIFVVLAEFGDTRHPAYCDSTTATPTCTNPSDGSPQKYDGPGHDEILSRPPRRQQHALAGRLQPGALQRHVLQQDGRLLPAPVLRSLHRER